MHRLSKVHPPEKTVVDDLTMAFLPGAKIGVLGYNGAGKSTLLRIMAGVDREYRGRAALAAGASVGMLEQEPLLDESRSVRENVEEGVAESVAWLERHLAEYGGTVVAVTHDRYFLDNVTGWILELDRGKGIPYEGNYSSWLEQKQARLAAQERAEKGRARTIAAELEWVRANPKGRRTKAKARLARYEQLVAEERNVKLEEVQIHIPPGPRLGEKVLTASGLRKGFGEQLLIEDLSFDLPRAGIVGVIGANGAGKTTLFRMITGEEAPDAGALELGDTVQLAYVDQARDALDPDKTVWEEISGGEEVLKVGERTVNSRQYTASFNFKGSDQQVRVGALSGGERNRVHLAKLLRSGGNLLLLDEPTNDLDVDTLRALEHALLAFPR